MEISFAQTGSCCKPRALTGIAQIFKKTRRAIAAGLLLTVMANAQEPSGRLAKVDFTAYEAASGIQIVQEEERLKISWPASRDSEGLLILNLESGKPLVESLALSRAGRALPPIARQVDPFTVLTVGERNAEKAARGMVFFDNPRERPFQRYPVTLVKESVRVSSHGSRATVSVGKAAAGSFDGTIEFTFYKNLPLVHAEAVLKTSEELRAILYDAGVVSSAPLWKEMVWLDPHGHVRNAKVMQGFTARPVAVRQRTLVAETENGSLAIFPPPHRYFYPLDFADNFEFAWFGEQYGNSSAPYGFGVRQPPEGDKRWVPWVDAPAGTEQRLGIFYLLSHGNGMAAIEEVSRFTRGDRFKKLPGYLTFTSHYHVEHTVDYLNRQKEQGNQSVPKGLESPGFISKFKEIGVDIVHLAEFHFGWTPGQPTEERLRMLKRMHEECQRLSDDELLILPGEEPNVHLGGHWISFFPKPVYWVLNRPPEIPFAQQIEGYGTVYHVGSPEDVLELMKRENGLMWTAHPRIKSSLGFPDRYNQSEFYKSDHFLGAAWKAMPSDLSRRGLGWRVLDLLDDMNQWGERKQVLGEVDVFRVEPDYELYAHANVNYIKSSVIPRFEDGWQPILDALRAGQFFVSTGEVLIPHFSVGEKESGEILKLGSERPQVVEVELEWTFPLAFAEVISGDGTQVFRHELDLSDTEAFGSRQVRVPIDLKGRTWVRVEAWDVAGNGAFTQPVWIEAEDAN